MSESQAMLTVHATLQPNGQVQLPPALARSTPVPVLVTILEPEPQAGQSTADDPGATGKKLGSIAALRALLGSPAFLALPAGDPQEVEARIQALRNDWNDA
ncbi:MAG TPA: hypothetical protein VLJ58_14040 [Ramlibacter sp.]|nr:hypothetical protein [Ramlibacter sp.]